MKKAICFFIAAAMSLLAFVGCQSEPIASEEKSGGTVQSSSNSTASFESIDPLGKYDPPITITTVGVLDATMETDESDPEKKSLAENRWVNTFMEKLGIKLEYKWIAADSDAHSAKWNTAIASGDLPDMARVDDSIYKSMLDGNLIADMTECFDTYASPLYKGGLVETNIQQMTFGGIMYGLPFPAKAFCDSNVLFIRNDWLKEVGKKVPETMEELTELAKSFQAEKLGGENTVGLLLGDDNTSFEGTWKGFFNGYGACLNYWLKSGDQLVYSNVQPEIRDALLAVQALYNDGVINKDFAVATSQVTSEYLANCQVGLMYGPGWAPVGGMEVSYDKDSDTEWVAAYPPSVSGDKVQIQTNSPRTIRIYVNKKCENPEAVVKMINLVAQLTEDDYGNYVYSPDAFPWMKFIPFSSFSTVTADLDASDDIRTAEKTGIRNFRSADGEGFYENYLLAKEGKSAHYWLTIYGEGGANSILYDAYQEGLLLIDAFNGLPTQNMSLKQQVLDDALKAAMLDVMMGEDIARFDKAVEEWYANGGQDITDDVNEWYQANS